MKLSNSAFAVLVVTAVTAVVFPMLESHGAFVVTVLLSGLVVGVRAFTTPVTTITA